ncbi:MAG: hypothetical protein ACD_49C00017G0008 [uncultured bacterium (gcode 4)]|uniref:Uncharacterized protein n=1 Tax=uncultured bacterium (gcode 4) TaxID=1234023 RepID=K2AY93_9BACT|nr:MAG: hypothetical protein ACD_49C00017G0008 [uncultured bacterium (gcode 4)]
MFSKRKKNVTKWIKRVDAVITWLILGWILASVYGVKKYEQHHQKDEQEKIEIKEPKKSNFLKQFFIWDEKQEQKDSLLKTVFKIILKNFLWKK